MKGCVWVFSIVIITGIGIAFYADLVLGILWVILAGSLIAIVVKRKQKQIDDQPPRQYSPDRIPPKYSFRKRMKRL
jgi:hypothetical protein